MIETALIDHSGRIREADGRRVKALAGSIKEVGLLNPVTVYRRSIIRAGRDVDGFGLIAGMHRLRACQSLGWSEIPAEIVDLNEHQRVIAECDENLCVSGLTPAQEAEFTAKRKAAYEVLHPEATNGRNQHSDRDGQLGQPSFADDTADKTGESARKVRRNAERGEKVCTSALAMVKGTKLDKGTYLDALKALSPSEQVIKVQADLAEKPKSKAVSTSNHSKIDADVKDRAAKEVAEMIAEHVPGEWWDAIKANLYAAKANNIANAFANITGESVMDKGAFR